MRYISLLRDDFSDEEKKQLLVNADNSYNPYAYLQKYFNRTTDLFNSISWLIVENYLPYNLLNKTNSMYMANGVEGRVPFLDIELVKAATRIPPALKITNNVDKWILREDVKGIIPERCRTAAKKPFKYPSQYELLKLILFERYLKNKLINLQLITLLLYKHTFGAFLFCL